MDIRKQIISFFEEELQIKIHIDFVFFKDTGIDGYDAHLLMKEFGKKFDIDMSSFNEQIYFTSEADLLNFPKTLFLRLIKGRRQKFLYFDVDHLIEVVNNKKWFDPKKND